MTGITEALADHGSLPFGDKIRWQRTADKHGIVRSTLTRNAGAQASLRNTLSRRSTNVTAESTTTIGSGACKMYSSLSCMEATSYERDGTDSRV